MASRSRAAWLTWWTTSASRSSTSRIRIESHALTECEEIELEFVSACRRSVEVAVGDGILDIEVDPEFPGQLNLAAIEIKRLE